MSNKETIIKDTIFKNGDDITLVRKDLDQGTWEWGVDNALKNLFQVALYSEDRTAQREVTFGRKVEP